jgi:hypothetical protein
VGEDGGVRFLFLRVSSWKVPEEAAEAQVGFPSRAVVEAAQAARRGQEQLRERPPVVRAARSMRRPLRRRDGEKEGRACREGVPRAIVRRRRIFVEAQRAPTRTVPARPVPLRT